MDGGYTVMLTDLPRCLSQGETLEEAVANIHEASHNSIASLTFPLSNSVRSQRSIFSCRSFFESLRIADAFRSSHLPSIDYR